MSNGGLRPTSNSIMYFVGPRTGRVRRVQQRPAVPSAGSVSKLRSVSSAQRSPATACARPDLFHAAAPARKNAACQGLVVELSLSRFVLAAHFSILVRRLFPFHPADWFQSH